MTFCSIAAYLLLIASLILGIIAVVGIAAWRLVYYVCRCRRAPIQKTVLLTAAGLWLVSAAIVALV